MRYRALFLFLLSAVVAPGPIWADDDWELANYRSLFADPRATSPGDQLTVLIAHSSQAESRAQSTTDKGFDFNASLIEDDETPRAGLNFDRSSSGEGLTRRQGSLRAQVSARVEQVLPNGDFVIRGMQAIVINGERQTITVNGVARPIDIASDNSILSSRLLNSEIVYSGEGWVEKGQRPGLLQRIASFLGL